MTKIAVLSDIHGNIEALTEVVNDLKSRQVSYVVNLGDHVSGPLWVRETLDFLKKQNWIHILGNHDRMLIKQNPELHIPSDKFARKLLNKDDIEWLNTLPSSKLLPDDVYIFHGTPANDSVYLLETVENNKTRLATTLEIEKRLGDDKSPVMLCGHSHLPRVVQISENCLIVNPGSVGLQAYNDEKPEAHVIENGSPHARYAILEQKEDNWLVDLIAVSYDYEKAAQKARNNDRRDWEKALLTGYMNDYTRDN
ncbi:MAG: hypothetical protein APR63_05365 [Desulfuromonas sp. SDB]|nr:MAG: hypothetical protein APR63_05365 [Desulfuromonas sp. SDB]